MKTLDELQTVYELMHYVAHKLTGRGVIIREQQPSDPHAVAWTRIDEESGLHVIEMAPGWGIGPFLHELAHIALGHTKRLKPSRLDAPVISKARLGGSVEAEAEALKAEWLALADRHKGEFAGSEYTSQLLALAKYHEGA